jgi:hypothetical protein
MVPYDVGRSRLRFELPVTCIAESTALQAKPFTIDSIPQIGRCKQNARLTCDAAETCPKEKWRGPKRTENHEAIRIRTDNFPSKDRESKGERIGHRANDLVTKSQ